MVKAQLAHGMGHVDPALQAQIDQLAQMQLILQDTVQTQLSLIQTHLNLVNVNSYDRSSVLISQLQAQQLPHACLSGAVPQPSATLAAQPQHSVGVQPTLQGASQQPQQIPRPPQSLQPLQKAPSEQQPSQKLVFQQQQQSTTNLPPAPTSSPQYAKTQPTLLQQHPVLQQPVSPELARTLFPHLFTQPAPLTLSLAPQPLSFHSSLPSYIGQPAVPNVWAAPGSKGSPTGSPPLATTPPAFESGRMPSKPPTPESPSPLSMTADKDHPLSPPSEHLLMAGKSPEPPISVSHVVSQQSKEGKYKCDHCYRVYTLQRSLIQHLKVHQDKCPYQCSDCGRRFSRKGHVEAHYRIHTQEKPFVCRTCSKSFNQKSGLSRHIRAHRHSQSCKIARATPETLVDEDSAAT